MQHMALLKDKIQQGLLEKKKTKNHRDSNASADGSLNLSPNKTNPASPSS